MYVVDHDEPVEVRAVVEYQPEGAAPIPVTQIEVSTSLDVAVLHLQRPAPAVLAAAGQATDRAPWRVETQPDPKAPVLTGTVDDPHCQLTNEAGKKTTLIQLRVKQQVGDYQGYSGSPVLAAPGGMPGGVLGVLVEQAFWRTSAQLGAKPPVANVLFAAPIERVIAEFHLAGVAAARSDMDIPKQASFEVRRPDQLDQIIDALLRGLAEPSAETRLVGLAGMAGSGKSVLAAAAARDTRVEDAFPGGQFWLELGPDPPLLQLQASLAAALGDRRPITDVPSGRARLSRLLGERRCLLVLDNVWDRKDVSAFAVAGPPGRVLVTTRDAATVPGATVIPVGELNPEAAMRLLASWAATEAGQLPEEAEQVARECGYLPLALAVCGALIYARTHSWPTLLGLLRHADLEALPIQLEDYPHPSLAVALGASVDSLAPEARDQYLRLAVFNGQGPIPAAAFQVLWGPDQEHTTALVEGLAGKSLLRAEDGRVSLHDLQMDYLVRRAPDVRALHNQLLAAYRDRCPCGWASGPDDGHFYQHLADHLKCAGRLQDLQALLLDLEWMNVKLATANIPGLLADYDSLPSDPAVQLVAGALRLSAHVLADDPGQLPSQLTGRLASQHDPQLRDLLQRTRSWPETPWLRPLTASLTPPGGPLLRTLTGHDGSVAAVAVSADGRHAVSGGRDGAVRVWDLDSGATLHTLTGHIGEVYAVAVSADGRRAVSGGADGTVRVWDLDSGETLHTLTGHDGSVAAVAVSADGRHAVSGGRDGAVRVWDLDSGATLHTLTVHDSVYAVAVSADGRRAVSGDDNGAVRVWDLDSGATLHTLTGHDSVYAVAVSADGRRAVSGGRDEILGRVRVWDLDTGTTLHTLTSHIGAVYAVAVSADGRRAVSGGVEGRTVRVWDLDTGAILHTLTGHIGEVYAVAVSADGRRAVSGGADGTVRVWDLDPGETRHLPTGHDSVTAVAVSADGRRAVSGGAEGGGVRVWDLDSGETLDTQTGLAYARAWAVAVSADGRRAVSGDYDGTVRVWDLESGTALRTLTGHAYYGFGDTVQAVAVSADGRRAVSGGAEGGAVKVWDLDSGETLHVLTGHAGGVYEVTVSADGRRAVSSGDDGAVRVWDLAAGTQAVPATRGLRRWFTAPHRRYVIPPTVRSLSASADGSRAVSGYDDGTVRVWDLDSGARLRTLTGHTGRVAAVAVSADGSRAVSGGADGTVRVWDLDSGKTLHVLTGHTGAVAAVAVSADGSRAVSGSKDQTVRVWDLGQGVEFATFVSDSEITALAATAPAMRVIAATSTGPVHLLELCECR
jgi:WD40 repeat protein